MTETTTSTTASTMTTTSTSTTTTAHTTTTTTITTTTTTTDPCGGGRCKVCTASFTDTHADGGKVQGTLTWGAAQYSGAVDEALVTGYRVIMTTSCGAYVSYVGSQNKVG